VKFYEYTEAVAAGPEVRSAYVVSPLSGAFLTDETTVVASLLGFSDAPEVDVALYAGTNEIVKAAAKNPATGYYEAVFTKTEIEAYQAIGAGGFLVRADGVTLGRTDVVFGEKPVKPENVIDDFETYFGNMDLLDNNWPTQGSGSIRASLNMEYVSSGTYGIRFDYTLSDLGSEQYVGTTTKYDGNWTEYNALQFYMKPDGCGQKVVIQVQTSSNSSRTVEFFLSDFAKTTEPKIVTIPFSSFVPQGGSATQTGVFTNASAITGFGLFCNSLPVNGEKTVVTSTLYFDNLRAINVDVTDLDLDNALQKGAHFGPAGTPPLTPEYEWAFDASAQGWELGAPTGDFSDAAFAQETSTLGDGAVRITADYAGKGNNNGPSVQKTFAPELPLADKNRLLFDFFYTPAARTAGNFVIRLDAYDASGAAVIGNRTFTVTLTGASATPGTPVGGTGYNRVPVAISYNNAPNWNTTSRGAPYEIVSIKLGILGAASSDYNGAVLLDNIRLTDYYADITNAPTDQSASAVDISVVDEAASKATYKLVDAAATDATKRLYAYLDTVGKSDKALFGQEAANHHKKAWQTPPQQNYQVPYYPGSSESDVKDITGSLPAVVGDDTLSLVGNEYPGNSAIDPIIPSGWKGNTALGAAKSDLLSAKEGAIISLSAHMPNFETAYNATTEEDRAAHQWNWSEYTTGQSNGRVLTRIIPGGDLNGIYNDYLDIVAEYAKAMNGELAIPGLAPLAGGAPILFRPFHEHNGTWFWFGIGTSDNAAQGRTEAAYIAAWRYTVEYLRDVKNVHNLLYVYSPNGGFSSDAAYLRGYPGDDYVDVIAFDQYNDGNAIANGFAATLKTTIDRVQRIAGEKGKVAVVSETGMRVQSTTTDPFTHDGISYSGNRRPNWYSEVMEVVSESDMAYYMIWSNFGVDAGANFYAPYKISDTRGHELADPFLDFYNDARSIFADGTNFYSMTVTPDVEVPSAARTGSIVSPSANGYLAGAATLIATAKNLGGAELSFLLASGGAERSYPASGLVGNYYQADVPQADVEAFGNALGLIRLIADGEVLAEINVVFGEALQKPVGVLDDFETYYGNDGQLRAAWAVQNSAPQPSLDAAHKYSGDYGLAFNYKLSQPVGGAEDYNGILTGYTADWSAYNAVQFYYEPDGMAQKAIFQLRALGATGNTVRDFEYDLSAYSDSDVPLLITIPFTAFTPKTAGTAIRASAIRGLGLWVNSVIPDGFAEPVFNVESSLYYDYIHGVYQEGLTGVVVTEVNEPKEVKIFPETEKLFIPPAGDVTLAVSLSVNKPRNVNLVNLVLDFDTAHFDYVGFAARDGRFSFTSGEARADGKLSLILGIPGGASLTAGDETVLLDVHFKLKSGVVTPTIFEALIADFSMYDGTAALPFTIAGGVARTLLYSYDMNGDGLVNLLDLSVALRYYDARETDASWLTSPAWKADIDFDGTVTVLDYTMLLNALRALGY
ncbi:MAG: dockerin type I domain-containing protein, partial [Clostridiales bacterium]|nr:dockerin type I domain-containing protein [Clostridiales bacterium]